MKELFVVRDYEDMGILEYYLCESAEEMYSALSDAEEKHRENDLLDIWSYFEEIIKERKIKCMRIEREKVYDL